MPHPHQSLLDELEYAIKHLVPTVDPKIRDEAQAVHDKLEANPETEIIDIRSALVELGKHEWPARHAFAEVAERHAGDKRKELLLERLNDPVKGNFETLLKDVSIDEIVKSDIFEEQFTPEERYHVEEGLVEADLALRDHVAELIAGNQKEEYATALVKWEKEKKELEEIMTTLRGLATEDASLTDEIMEKVSAYQEGWSLVERDFDEETLRGEIDYYRGILGLRE